MAPTSDAVTAFTASTAGSIYFTLCHRKVNAQGIIHNMLTATVRSLYSLPWPSCSPTVLYLDPQLPICSHSINASASHSSFSCSAGSGAASAAAPKPPASRPCLDILPSATPAEGARRDLHGPSPQPSPSSQGHPEGHTACNQGHQLAHFTAWVGPVLCSSQGSGQ